ncbi:TKL family protein kinase [Pelomyxa schiedti]|nr:TKL family protein kinase [Pelomyxa schiedti]
MQVTSPLGTGSYGTVFRCRHIPSGRDVAVKALHEAIMSDYNSERFRLEAEIVSGLRHPNIVKCIGTCITGAGRLNIVSELKCCSLKQLLKNKYLNFKEVVAVSMGVSKGMDSLHRQNYMHRDLSSNNVLMDSDGTPKICDFGVSRGITPQQQPQTIVPGTQAHMAPQMFTNHKGTCGDLVF